MLNLYQRILVQLIRHFVDELLDLFLASLYRIGF